MELQAHVNDISEDDSDVEVTFGNVICPDCVLVEIDGDRDIFDII